MGPGVDSPHPAPPVREGLMGDWYDKQTIGLLPERAAQRWAAREALAFQGKRWTFAELHAGVEAAAKGLLQLGIAPGDKVALWMVNRPEWLHAMFAIMQIGAVLVPLNTRFRTEDMTYVLGQSDAIAVILGDRSGSVDYLGMMRAVAPDLGARPDARFPALRHVIALSDRPHVDTIDWHEMLEDGRRVDDAALRAPARSTPRTAPSSSIRRVPPASPRVLSTTIASSATRRTWPNAWASLSMTSFSCTCRSSTRSASSAGRSCR